MKVENIASTSTSLPFVRRSGYCFARVCLGGQAWIPSYGMCHSAVFPARAGFVVRFVHSVCESTCFPARSRVIEIPA